MPRLRRGSKRFDLQDLFFLYTMNVGSKKERKNHMAKSNGGMFSFLVGVVAGAGALFLSKEENRKKTKRVVGKAASRAKKAKMEYEKNPKAFKKKVAKQAETTARKVVKKGVKAARKTVKKQVAKKPTRKTAKK